LRNKILFCCAVKDFGHALPLHILAKKRGRVFLLNLDDDINGYLPFELKNPESFIGELQYLETKVNTDIPFLINIGMNSSPYTSTFNLFIEWGEGQVYQTNFKLEIGQSEILLVDDGTSFGGLFIQPDIWYEHVLDSLGREVHHSDLNIFGDPTYEFVSNFPVVIWFAGYQNENTLNKTRRSYRPISIMEVSCSCWGRISVKISKKVHSFPIIYMLNISITRMKGKIQFGA